jgi:predicted DNA-binding transcriptional regulator AlpA
MAGYSVIQTAELLTFSALLTLLGRKSRQAVYDLMRRDQSFPRPRKVGSDFSIAWQRSEVMAWIASLPRAELDGLDAIERRQRAKQARATEVTA